MQVYELLPEDLVHYGDVAGVAPVGIVHRCEGDVLLLALYRRQHHVC